MCVSPQNVVRGGVGVVKARLRGFLRTAGSCGGVSYSIPMSAWSRVLLQKDLLCTSSLDLSATTSRFEPAAFSRSAAKVLLPLSMSAIFADNREILAQLPRRQPHVTIGMHSNESSAMRGSLHFTRGHSSPLQRPRNISLAMQHDFPHATTPMTSLAAAEL